MERVPIGFWGKLGRNEDGSIKWHPLIDHCADVAAVCEAVLSRTLIRQRLARLGGREESTEVDVQRLAALTAFHDIGKFNLGFQNKAEPHRQPRAGHVSEVLGLFGDSPGIGQERLCASMPLEEIAAWAPEQGGLHLLVAAIAHHGRPVEAGGNSGPKLNIWRSEPGGRDPFTGIADLSARVRKWFPEAFRRDGIPLPSATEFQHGFCGLVTLADWLGSNRNIFQFSSEADADRMVFARAAALDALRDVALDAAFARAALPKRAPIFSDIADFTPRAAQRRLLELPVTTGGSLALLESETGSGKTEAALARFLALFQAGEVDGLYFALPTRAAAVQIHRRITAAIQRAFREESRRPPAILAVPGYIAVDDRQGRNLLERFEVLWNDIAAERYRFRGWAAEHPKRYLAGAISVGTIDQALLSTLAVSHSHMRATALLRQLLVVDEVHASDAYMTAVLREVLKFHLDAGGHALLLSATLGSSGCSELLSAVRRQPRKPPPLADAAAAAYPLLTTIAGPGGDIQRHSLPADTKAKTVRRILTPYGNRFGDTAALALDAATQGARVLIIRNTVRDCVRTQLALEEIAGMRGGRNHGFSVAGALAPHHARFAREDRQLLDDELERRFGGESGAPCVIAATQTVQQSLDIDADLMLTDLCPMDVMLQRIGRLHRHERTRSGKYRSPEVIVLTPGIRDLSALFGRDGKARGDQGLGAVYEDLRIIEATWRALERCEILEIPAMNRRLVETATHPEALAAIVRECGGSWKKHAQFCDGSALASRGLARLNLVERGKEFGSYKFMTAWACGSPKANPAMGRTWPMPDHRYNLLTDPLISVICAGRDPARRTLPEVLAALARGEPLEFAALQPHQFHAWHAFLAQLGAIAAYHAGAKIAALSDPAEWASALRALAGGRDEPWCLAVSDPAQPAFMQPPVPDGSLAQWNTGNETSAPDEIDILETAKNHDVKMRRIAAPAPDHWLFALIALQTMQGFSGRDNYGVARMNGGISNRPCFAAARNLASSTRFVRDVELLLELRGSLIDDRGYDSESGLALVWLEPWNGSDQLSLSRLDPFFIEICRRIRLLDDNGRLAARWTTSKSTRIAAKEQKGNLGDPWVPVRIEDAAALTAKDLNYQRLQEVLFGAGYKPSPASLARSADGDAPILICQLLARDQGKTDGYHERLIPIPVKARALLATAGGRRRIGEISRARVEAVKEVLDKAMRPALAALLQADPPKLDFRDARIEPFRESFDREVDRVFFGALLADVDRDPPGARIAWLEQLLGFARAVIERAKHSAPIPSARRFRAQAAADRIFNGSARRLRAEAGESIKGANDDA